MSHASSPYTTVAALHAMEQILGPDRVWNAVSDRQRDWLEHHVRLVPELGKIAEIATHATPHAQKHVDFLKKHGWEAQITECGPDEFLTAAVMDVLGRWLDDAGKRRRLKGGVAAANLRRGVQVHVRSATGERCVRVATQGGDVVWLEMMPEASEGIALAIDTQSRFSNGLQADDGFDGLIFPMIDFGIRVDLDWLPKIWTVSERGQVARILEAKQALQLKANHVGFRARASDEMRGSEESCLMPAKPPFVIDQPFVMAVMRPGLSLPLFVAHLTQDAWKNPGDLGA